MPRPQFAILLRALVALAACAAMGLAAALLNGCGDGGKKPSPPSTASFTPEAVSRPPGYAGAAACRECHEPEHKSWQRSFHRTMTQTPDGDRIHADFNNVTLRLGDEQFHLTMEGSNRWVTITDLAPAPTPGQPPPEPLKIQPSLVTGSHHLQVFWMPGGNEGDAHVGFPFTWLNEERRWVPRHDTFIRDPNAQPPVEVWNGTCIRCHTTGAQPGWDADAKIFHTRTANLGIACEACHGPGEKHITHWRAEKTAGRSKLAAGTRDTTIVHPENLTATRASQICGSCHSMKWFDNSENWSVTGFRFRPGDDLDATTPVMRPTQLDKQPWLKAAADKHPALLDDFFWKDGQVRVSGREFNGLIESPCYQRGQGKTQMSCLSCHSMHKGEPDDQLARGMEGNQSCLQCHDKMKADMTAHTRHAAASAGSLCANCHMPHTTYGVLKAIRSHQITSPNIASELATGRPNACTLCHLDKPLGWTADNLAKWFKQPVPSLAPEQTTTAAGVLWSLKGDAGVRALTAWHFGWDSAQTASETHWMRPFLGQLLDDDYAAVRIVASRALIHLPGAPIGYDPVTPPRSRAPIAPVLAGRVGALSDPALLFSDGRLDTNRFTRLLEQRDVRVVRLRE